MCIITNYGNQHNICPVDMRDTRDMRDILTKDKQDTLSEKDGLNFKNLLHYIPILGQVMLHTIN